METLHKFRMKISPLVIWITLFSTLLLSCVIFTAEEASINWHAYLWSLAAAAFVSAVWSLSMVAYYKVILTGEDIKGFNFWGMSRTLRWNDITAVKSVNFIGLRYLKVFSNRTSLPLWIPLFLKNMREFTKFAASVPPDGNVFREYYSNNSD